MAAVLAFHAHPDDEVLLTGGTLARLAAAGHRTVVVVACCGGLGKGTTTIGDILQPAPSAQSGGVRR